MLQALLDLGSALMVGQSLTVFDIDHAVFGAFEGYKSPFSSLNLRIGTTASPPAGVPVVPAGRAQLAEVDSSRITITRV